VPGDSDALGGGLTAGAIELLGEGDACGDVTAAALLAPMATTVTKDMAVANQRSALMVNLPPPARSASDLAREA
jgi:hypothetical protein